MEIKTIKLYERTRPQLWTEILFNIASEKADSCDLVRFELPTLGDGTDEKAFTAATQVLKALKRSASIQLFADEESFALGKTEAAYLLNKFPSEASYRGSESCKFFIVKF